MSKQKGWSPSAAIGYARVKQERDSLKARNAMLAEELRLACLTLHEPRPATVYGWLCAAILACLLVAHHI